MDHPHASTVRQWREQGLSDAEIGRRLGISADGLRDLLGEPHRGDPDDDNEPNTAPTR